MNTLAKITKQLGFIFITLIVVSACKGIKIADIKNKNTTTTLLIGHYKVECDKPFTIEDDKGKEKTRYLCLQIKINDKQGKYGKWKKYAGDIKGFTYNWGYNYEIEVTPKDILPKPSKAPFTEYTFKKNISDRVKVASDSLFRLTVSLTGITTADAIKKPNKDKPIYRIYNEIDFKCDSTEKNGTSQCDSIKENIDADNAIKFIMSHDQSISNRLNISSIACASARSSFKTDCP